MKKISINSDFRNDKNNSSTTDFTFKLSTPITIRNYVQLYYAAIPNTSYLINSSNNIFKVTFWNGTVKQITIPSQNFTTDTLATYIKNNVNYNTFTPVYNSDTYKYSFTSSTLDFTINYVSNSVNKILGLLDTDQNSTWLSLKATNAPDFWDDKLLFISIEGLYGNIISNKSFSKSFIIPVTSARGNIIYYLNDNNDDDNKIEINSTILLNEFNVKIKKTDGTLWNNNGSFVDLILSYM